MPAGEPQPLYQHAQQLLRRNNELAWSLWGGITVLSCIGRVAHFTESNDFSEQGFAEETMRMQQDIAIPRFFFKQLIGC